MVRSACDGSDSSDYQFASSHRNIQIQVVDKNHFCLWGADLRNNTDTGVLMLWKMPEGREWNMERFGYCSSQAGQLQGVACVGQTSEEWFFVSDGELGAWCDESLLRDVDPWAGDEEPMGSGRVLEIFRGETDFTKRDSPVADQGHCMFPVTF